jgi:hypothetical protein
LGASKGSREAFDKGGRRFNLNPLVLILHFCDYSNLRFKFGTQFQLDTSNMLFINFIKNHPCGSVLIHKFDFSSIIFKFKIITK